MRKRTKLKLTDRGHTRYFHGREKILANFSDELSAAIDEYYRESGTIFLIQGAPGAGKTALLYRFRDLAAAGGDEVGGKKWRVLRIGKNALYNPTVLMSDADETYKSEKTAEWSARAEVGFRGLFSGGGARKASHRSADVPIPKLLEQLADKKPLLLVLDEVQTLGRRLDSEKTDLLEAILERIHNGEFKKPVVLACGGLGNSSEVFAGLGISRFKTNCLVNLGQLSEAAERAVIRDWLVKEGEAQEADIQPWITAISKETYGWPQHIAIYAQTAAKRLKVLSGQVTPEGLDWVLTNGRIGKRNYYRQRSDFLSRREVKVFALATQDVSSSEGMDREDLLERLMDRGSMSEEKAFRLFQKLLHKGVLARVDSDYEAYDIPIPSMKDHLFGAAGLKV